MRYLAVDIGASSGKIIAGELKDGTLKSEVVHRFPNEIKEKGGYLVWDLSSLYSAIIEGLTLAKKADYISIDTWGVDSSYLIKMIRL